MMSYLLLAGGLIMLTVGGEALIRGSLGAAKRLNISPLLSGLVIVGFGTSSPELVVSLSAAFKGSSEIAIGNVLGSNIANILLILGVCALITPLTVQPMALKRDAVTLVTASTLLVLLIMLDDSVLGLSQGLILLFSFMVYLLWAYKSESVPSELYKAEAEEVTKKPISTKGISVLIVIGLVLLIIGAKIFVNGAVAIAQHLGVSEALIGLTVVAVGTSLPEFIVSVIASIRGHADVAVGNILGSNIFNILGIFGISACIHDLEFSQRMVSFDQFVVLISAVLLLLFAYTDRKISRVEGAVFLVGYIAYVWISYAKF